jgi:iron complex outermembrane receptor protein
VLALCLGATLVAGEVVAAELEEVVVTAEKRQNSLQDVPDAVSALSQGALDSQGITDLGGVTDKVPSFHIEAPNGVVWAFMRGTGNSNPTAGGDNSVAVHLDGVYMGFASGAMVDLWDIQRVEVLRGPQGTLYGRNATGGSINIIPDRPKQDFEAYGDVSTGNYGDVKVRGVINPGALGGFRTRIAFTYSRHDGYQKNLYPGGKDSYADDTWMLRLSGDLDIGSRGTLELTGLASRTDAPTSSPVRPGPVYPAFYAPFVPDPKPTDPFTVYKNLNETGLFSTYGANANLSFDLGPVTFRSVLGYYDITRATHTDWDGSKLNELDFLDRDGVHQSSLEVQLLSKDSSKLQWIVGAYGLNLTNQRLNDILVGQFLAPNPPFPIRVILNGNLNVDSYALFGQASYPLADDVSLTAGIRRAWDHKWNDATNYQGPAALVGTPAEAQLTAAGGYNLHWSAPMGKVSLDWKVHPDNMLYASYSRGYKSGGFQTYGLSPADGPAGTPAAQPETVNSYEIGSKNMFFDRRFQLNVAVFYADYQSIQQTYFVPGSFAPDVANVGDGKATGIETDWNIAVTDSVRVDGSWGYIDTKYDGSLQYDIASCSPLPPFPCPAQVNIKGNQFVATPKNSLNIGLEYAFGRAQAWSARVDWGYHSRTYYSMFEDPTRSQAPYGKLDARLKYAVPGGKWSAEAYVQNAFNKDIITTEFSGSSLLGSDVPVAWYAPPRLYGVRFGYHF